MIDKLEAYQQPSEHIENIVQRAIDNGMSVKQVHLRDRKAYKMINNGHGNVYVRFNPFTRMATKIVTNPSDWPSFETYINDMRDLFRDDLKIVRLDLAADVPKDFDDVFLSMHFGQKMNRQIWFEGRYRTGCYIGSDLEKIAMYDKSRHRKQRKNIDSPPCTRIETRLTGNKLPSRYLHEMYNDLNERHFENYSEPLGKLTMYDIAIDKPESGMNRSEIQRITRVEERFMWLGFFDARKTFNRQNNYSRDYAKYVSLSESVLQPKDLFLESIRAFVGVPNEITTDTSNMSIDDPFKYESSTKTDIREASR